MVVGVAMVIGSSDGMLWVDELAVPADQRGLGLARALLSDSFAEGRRRGLTRSGLSTDSRTGAPGLYEHVGMEVAASFRRLALPL
ncbi:GNAT family N-acetyltransferase [Janibacter hoylei]|uniref:GNAT family N-acetyltransferase n=1 Tax=Janibacter hoylei TaxID=364298 RepID=UPI00369503DC